MSVLVLDAMGVLYNSGDDVADLLIPFVQRYNTDASIEEIEHAYLQASLGRIDNSAFWKKLNLDPAVEDEYLSKHCLTDGVDVFLPRAAKKFKTLCCLSNDVSAWSVKLRTKFSLTNCINHWLISGDVGYRKPSTEIYLLLLDSIAAEPSSVLFIDDRARNLDAARSLGLDTVLFDPSGASTTSTHTTIHRLAELLD